MIRYAVVGAGWISQEAFLPSVSQSGNSCVTAIVSGDGAKANKLAGGRTKRMAVAPTIGKPNDRPIGELNAGRPLHMNIKRIDRIFEPDNFQATSI